MSDSFRTDARFIRNPLQPFCIPQVHGQHDSDKRRHAIPEKQPVMNGMSEDCPESDAYGNGQEQLHAQGADDTFPQRADGHKPEAYRARAVDAAYQVIRERRLRREHDGAAEVDQSITQKNSAALNPSDNAYGAQHQYIHKSQHKAAKDKAEEAFLEAVDHEDREVNAEVFVRENRD